MQSDIQSDFILVGLTEVRDTSIRALISSGVPAASARVQADLLIAGELCGRPSHGLLRLPRVLARIRNGVCDPRTSGSAEWVGDSFLRVDGQGGLGPVVARNALSMISVRAKKSGVALAAISSNNHLGMLGYYAEQVARSGQVLIAISTSEALVHPWGGRVAMLGTNPIAIGVPADPHPMVLDMATSEVSMGKIHDHAQRGQSIPLGWALDAQGEPTTDAAAAKSGAIAPFGGPKGYALGLSIEVLVIALTATASGRQVKGTLDATEPCNKGDVFIVAEINAELGNVVSAYLQEIRTSPPADPKRPVSVPGDRAMRSRDSLATRGLQLPAPLWKEIRSLAA